MKKTFVLGILFSFALTLLAQSWKPLLQEVKGNKEFANAPVTMLLDSVSVDVSQSGSGSFYIRKVMLIGTESGALNNRVIIYDYDPLTAFAEFTNVTIYGADGHTRQLDPTKACDYAAPARAIYWGARQIMVEPGLLNPGDIIDYTISKKGFTYALLTTLPTEDERFIPPMRGEFYDIVPFWVNEPTMKKIYRVSFPKEKEVQYEFYQGQASSSYRMEGDRKVLTFSMDMTMPFKREPNMSDFYDVAPKLMLSSTDNWREKSLWFYNVNEEYGSFEAMPEAQKMVDELLKGVKDEMRKISILTHWVADNMRYSGISMGKGEGYTLHNTRMNFLDRCGVCKDKAALLISMLRMAGFESYPAMTMAGSRIETIPADHFNHCVTVVKLSDGTYMPLDPTWVPFNRELWSSAEQQQHYLPGVPEGSDLLITPVSAPENHYFKIHANTTLNEDGTLSGEFTIMAEGQSDAAVRRPFVTGFADRIVQSLENELFAISPQAILKGYEANNPKNYQDAPIELTMRFEIPSYATAGNGVLVCKPLVYSNLYNSVRSFLRVNTDAGEKQYAFKDACSRFVELTETMKLPKGYTMIQQAKENEVSGEVASFKGKIEQSGEKLKVNQTLSLGKRVYEATEWKEFRAAVKGYKEFADEELIFVKKSK